MLSINILAMDLNMSTYEGLLRREIFIIIVFQVSLTFFHLLQEWFMQIKFENNDLSVF